MSAIVSFEVVDRGIRRPRPRHLLLRPSDDGWTLLTPGGETVFRGLGARARRQCLEVARAVGALAVIS
jgi:hypothetical protein